jgi:hypothetical protein
MSRSDTDKNARAGTLTGLVCGTLLFLALIISWTPPMPEQPQTEEGMEVNLGDGDLGEGETPPLSPLPPAEQPTDAEVTTPKATTSDVTPREVETDDNDKEAPEVVAPKPTKPVEKKTVTPPKETPRPVVRKDKPAEVEKPKPDPKPKFVYQGGRGDRQGGNEADSWNESKGQGINGGRGDQGRSGGNPDSDNYQGGGGRGSGVAIQKGLSGRRITRYPSFEDDFSENAKVAVDIRVDANGKVISAVYQPKGSTTGDMSMRTIAINKALQLRFNGQPDGPETDLGTIVFNFKVR